MPDKSAIVAAIAQSLENEFHVRVSAYEPAISRYTRLGSLLVLVERSMMGNLTPVLEVHDRKGVLTVTWEREPQDYEKAVFSAAWHLLHEANVDHEVVG